MKRNKIYEKGQGFRVIFRKPFAVEELTKIGLNERQKKAIEYLKENKKVTRKEYASLFNCSVRTAFDNLQRLVDINVLKRKGMGKHTYYELG